MSKWNAVDEDRPVCLMAAEKYIPEGSLAPEIVLKTYEAAKDYEVAKLDPKNPEQKAKIDAIEDCFGFLSKLIVSSGIKTRYTVLDDFYEFFTSRDFSPSVMERGKIWREQAPRMAMMACNKMLQNWGGDKDRIKHVLAHSTTGWDVPGLAHHVVYDLELPQDCRPYPLNFIGCHGGMTLLCTAATISRSHQDDLSLVVTSETCSILATFYQPGQSFDRSMHIPYVLFGDSAACCLVGRPQQSDVESSKRSGFALWELNEFGCQYIPNTRHVLLIRVSEAPFCYIENSIKKELPVHLNREMTKHFNEWLDRVLGCSFEDVEFAVHPGGKRLLDNFAKLVEDLGVEDGQKSIEHCIHNIQSYGNLASSAILVILSDLCRRCVKDNIYMMAMGPGVCMEFGGMSRYNASTWRPWRKVEHNLGGGSSSVTMILFAVIFALVAFIASGASLADLL
jgi:predicted naringenin-chalcone synthase